MKLQLFSKAATDSRMVFDHSSVRNKTQNMKTDFKHWINILLLKEKCLSNYDKKAKYKQVIQTTLEFDHVPRLEKQKQLVVEEELFRTIREYAAIEN